MDASADSFDHYADTMVGLAVEAAQEFRRFDQTQTDRIVEAAFRAAFAARFELARLAIEETGMGLYEHKVLKNAWASWVVFQDLRPRRTVGILRQDEESGLTEVAHPKGPILALTPVTNPTSTTIFKVLLCLKTRNPVIFSAHRGARKCSREAARLMAEAALAAGAPAGCIQSIAKSQSEYLDRVMRHRKLALILATGTEGIVRTARASGTPTLGAGPGNVPVYVHGSADLEAAARGIVHSKTFDQGVVCASEQALIVEPSVDQKLRPLLKDRGAYFCRPEETEALGPVCYDPERRSMRAEVVGRPAAEIAERAGFQVPEKTRLLIVEPQGIGAEHPLSHEILAPVLAYYRVESYDAARAACEAVLRLGGLGHTVGVYTQDTTVIEDFARMPAGRLLVNTPTTGGAIGGIYNRLRPSLTLAGGAAAKGLAPDNITVEHLLEVHRVARPRPNRGWLQVARERWLDPNLRPEDLERSSSPEASREEP